MVASSATDDPRVCGSSVIVLEAASGSLAIRFPAPTARRQYVGGQSLTAEDPVQLSNEYGSIACSCDGANGRNQ